ncbi:hypothetical protein [Allobaculum sp. Allo2]|uniref:hypothetical protein n=1 Tax=unclassified Allobaculum TaxID=2623473 RepID=UPI001F609924|nr:hypothetical protein [Allobaculum sp. Allo2]UNT92668.1 hypothetical protein KWG61_11130 [Allobaculum sp. Allo2]
MPKFLQAFSCQRALNELTELTAVTVQINTVFRFQPSFRFGFPFGGLFSCLGVLIV